MSSKCIIFRISLLLIICLSLTSFAFAETTLYVWANAKMAVSSELFGINNDWRQFDHDEFDEVADAFKGLNSSDYLMMRFPGGWESEWFDWDNQNCDGWSKAPVLDGVDITKFKNNVDNYTIVVPTAVAMDEALWSQDWWDAVYFCKTEAVNAINQAGPSDVIAVEIGNEWWLQYGGGVSRLDKCKKYAKVAMNIAEYIAQQFPNRTFKLLVNGDYTVPSEFTTMKNAFTKAYNEIDGVALHTYSGYDTTTHNISDLGWRIEACADNFNSSKDMYIYSSEWMANKGFNNSKKYMEAANVIVDIIHVMARAGVDAGAYWPPDDTFVPGVGLINGSITQVYPCGQILGELQDNFIGGEVVNTASANGINITGSLKDTNTLVLYITGKESPTEDVKIRVNGFDIDYVDQATRLRASYPNHTDWAQPYVEESISVNFDDYWNVLRFTINDVAQHEIIKLVLKK